MRRALIRIIAASVLTLGAAITVPAVTATPALAATCNITPGTDVPETGQFVYEGVNMRSGPGTNCASRGLGYGSHSVTYHCWMSGDWVNGWPTWTYLTDNTTGISGWSSDQFLRNYGSTHHC